MQSIIKSIGEGLLGLVTVGFFLAFYIILPVGWLYWIWMAFQLGSFSMFVVALIPLLHLITAPVGVYALFFGLPDWVFIYFF